MSTRTARRGATKIVPLGELSARAAEWRTRGERVAFARGSFDLLDVAQVRALAAARRGSLRLVVGVRDDGAVARRLGPGRPVLVASERVGLAAALRIVDLVVVLDGEAGERAFEAEAGRAPPAPITDLDPGAAGPGIAPPDAVARVRARQRGG